MGRLSLPNLAPSFASRNWAGLDRLAAEIASLSQNGLKFNMKFVGD